MKTVQRKVIGTSSTESITETIDSQICSLVEKCQKKQIGHESFDNYFQLINHSKETRNNNNFIRLPKVKLEVAKRGYKIRQGLT